MMKPKIRFNGFTDDWEQRKLGELTIYRNGTGHEEKQSESGKYELINLNSISIDGGLKPSGKFIDEETETLLKDDLVMVLSDVGHGDLLGRVAIIPENNRFVLNQRVALLRNNSSVDIKYLFSYINAHQIYFKKQGAGSSQLNISRGSVENFEVLLPHKDEQKKIGKYLSSIDNLITLHQRKYNLCNKVKVYAWEQRKLGDVAQITMGQSPAGSTYSDVPSDYILVQGNADLENGWVKPRVWTTQITKQAYIGDLIMSVRAPAGAMGKTSYNAVIGRGVAAIKGNEFIYQLLVKMDKEGYWKKDSTGSTFESLNSESIKNAEIKLPSNEEQTVIGTYFEQLDHLITLHQRKCDGLKKLKKYMLQNMFPQNGEKTPKIRFQGFINAWEQRKLEEIYQNIGNAFVGTATPYYVDTGHFYLESNNIKDGQINRNNEVFINDEFYERQKDKWLHTGDMVMVQSGHVGHTAVIPEELDNSAAHALIMFRNPKIEIEPYFLNYQYQTIKSKRKINNITTGNTIKHILASDMYNFIVDVSDIEEQQQIANYFLELDHLITLHQRKVEQMKNLKKYMLQNMFPAEKQDFYKFIILVKNIIWLIKFKDNL